MKIRIRFVDNAPAKEFDVSSMGMKDGFLTFSKDGLPLVEGGESTLDFVYSTQAHFVRDIENIDPEQGEKVFSEMINSTPSLPDKPVKEEKE